MFHFKHFSIIQESAAQKVGTDAMILGSLCDFKKNGLLLDIGTGTGVLSLMLAQRFQPQKITAIDLDELALKDAQQNFQNTPFSTQIELIHSSLQNFKPEVLYDGIISNPPFFNGSTKSKTASVNFARHTESLSYTDLLKGIDRLLKTEGEAWVILPIQEELRWKSEVERFNQLFINTWIVVYGKPLQAKRFICRLTRYQTEISTQTLTIRNENETYSEEYISLTAEFHDRNLKI